MLSSIRRLNRRAARRRGLRRHAGALEDAQNAARLAVAAAGHHLAPGPHHAVAQTEARVAPRGGVIVGRAEHEAREDAPTGREAAVEQRKKSLDLVLAARTGVEQRENVS